MKRGNSRPEDGSVTRRDAQKRRKLLPQASDSSDQLISDRVGAETLDVAHNEPSESLLAEAEEGSAKVEQRRDEAKQDLKEAKQDLKEAKQKLEDADQKLEEAKQELKEAKQKSDEADSIYFQNKSPFNKKKMDKATENVGEATKNVKMATKKVGEATKNVKTAQKREESYFDAFQQQNRRLTELQASRSSRQQALGNRSDTSMAAAAEERSRQREVMAAAFNATYQDADDLVTLFDAHVKMCFGLHDDHFRYTTIVQSSGYGKSRLVKEYAKQAYTIQVCLREQFDMTGYPVRWDPVATYLTNASKRRFEVFFMLCVEALHEYIAEPSRNGNYEQFEPFYRTFLENAIKQKRTADMEQITSNMIVPIAQQPLLICFDEPYVWIKPGAVDEPGIPSIFQNFRHATAILTAKAVLCVLTDTMAKIANFTPSAYLGFSARGILPQSHLMPPFYFVWTSNLSVEDELAALPVMGEENKQLLRLFSRGRPLWKSFLPMTHGNPELMVKFAGTKLKGGVATLRDAEIHLAWLACRYCLHLVPQSSFCDALLAGHMATCLWISSDRYAVLISYASEPVLSEASAWALSSVDNASAALQTLTSALMNGLVEASYRGELVARILLLPFTTLQTTYFSQAFTLHCYLSSLLGSKTVKNILKLPAAVLAATLQVTHFVPIDYEISCPEQLQALYDGRAAAICKRNQKGDDLVIPFKMAQDNGSPEAVYSAIKIQCKNWASDLHFDNVTVQGLRHLSGATRQQQWRYTFSEWADDVPVPPYITLYMQLGSSKRGIYDSYSEIHKLQQRVKLVKDADTRELLMSLPHRAKDGQLSFILAGLDSSVYLSATRIMSELKGLLHAWPNVTSLINNQSTVSSYKYLRVHHEKMLASLDKYFGVQRWPPGKMKPKRKSTRIEKASSSNA